MLHPIMLSVVPDNLAHRAILSTQNFLPDSLVTSDNQAYQTIFERDVDTIASVNCVRFALCVFTEFLSGCRNQLQ